MRVVATVVLVAVVAVGCGEGETEAGPTAAQREACGALRDMVAAVQSDTGYSDELDAFVAAANRTADDKLVAAAATMRSAFDRMQQAQQDVGRHELGGDQAAPPGGERRAQEAASEIGHAVEDAADACADVGMTVGRHDDG